jgi:hypothetical protein
VLIHASPPLKIQISIYDRAKFIRFHPRRQKHSSSKTEIPPCALNILHTIPQEESTTGKSFPPSRQLFCCPKDYVADIAFFGADRFRNRIIKNSNKFASNYLDSARYSLLPPRVNSKLFGDSLDSYLNTKLVLIFLEAPRQNLNNSTRWHGYKSPSMFSRRG